MMPFLLILFFLCLLLFIPITFRLYFLRHDSEGYLELEVYIHFRLFGFRIEIPEVKNILVPFLAEIFSRFENVVLGIRPLMLKLEKKINLNTIISTGIKKLAAGIMDKNILAVLTGTLNPKCKKLNCSISFGLHDSMLTALTFGLAGIITGSILAIIEEKICPLKNKKLELIPVYNQYKLEVDFESIFSLTMGNIILTALKLLFYSLEVKSRARKSD